MVRVRQQHIGKTRPEQREYINNLNDGGATSGTPRPHAATDQLFDTTSEASSLSTHRPPSPTRWEVFDQISQNLGAILIAGLTIVLGCLGYFFLELKDIDREVGEIGVLAEKNNKGLERIERKIDLEVKDLQGRLSRSETRLDRHFESGAHHASPP